MPVGLVVRSTGSLERSEGRGGSYQWGGGAGGGRCASHSGSCNRLGIDGNGFLSSSLRACSTSKLGVVCWGCGIVGYEMVRLFRRGWWRSDDRSNGEVVWGWVLALSWAWLVDWRCLFLSLLEVGIGLYH